MWCLKNSLIYSPLGSALGVFPCVTWETGLRHGSIEVSPSSPVSSALIQVIAGGRDTTEEALIRLLCLYPQIKPRREQSRGKTRRPLWTDTVDRH